MSDPFFLTAGDLLPIIEGTLEDEHGDPIDLSAASAVTFSVQSSGIASTMFSASVAFSTATVGASAAHVEHHWNSGTVPTAPGFYQGQWRVTQSSGKKLTVPNPGYVPITVGTSLGG
jgi:hypothetical protein